MALRVRSVSEWYQGVVARKLSPEAKRKAIARHARGKLADAQDRNSRALGRVPPHETFVDGRRGAMLESINPNGGTIVFKFELIADVLEWIAEELRARSPVRSGRYRDSHRLFADGREIALGPDLPDAAEYSFTNTVPYSRKIEIAVTESGRRFTIHVENRIYDRTSYDAAQRFSNIAKIGFTYRSLAGGAGKRQLRYPTITVRKN